MLKKTAILAILALLIYPNSYSQDQTKHEYSVWLSGGISALKYDAENYATSQEPGGAFGIGYSYFINDFISLNTGAEFVSYNSKATIVGLSDKYTLSDESETFEFRSNVYNHKEKQKTYFVNIPLTLQLQSAGKHKFFFSLGGKIGIPVTTKYNTESKKIVNTGYYPDINQEFTDQEFRGFGTFINKSNKKNLNLRTAYMVTIESGVKLNLKHTRYLYAGFYVDYGVSNILKSNDSRENLISYNTSDPQNFNINSIFNSHYNDYEGTHSFVENVVPFAIGVRLRMTIGKD